MGVSSKCNIWATFLGKGEFKAGAITGYWIGECALFTYLQKEVDLGVEENRLKGWTTGYFGVRKTDSTKVKIFSMVDESFAKK